MRRDRDALSWELQSSYLCALAAPITYPGEAGISVLLSVYLSLEEHTPQF
jgi:hypothetical protein